MKDGIWMGPVIRVEGDVSGEDLPWLKQKKFLKIMDLQARRVLKAVYLALKDSETGRKEVPELVGVAVSLESLPSGENDWEEAGRLAREKSGPIGPSIAEIGNCLPPLALIPRLPNSIAGHVAREFGITGPCWTSGGRGGAGLDAVVQGARWIADGECRRVVVARAEERETVAILLESIPGPKSLRRIRSWSMGNPEISAAEGHGEMAGVGDWDGWKNYGVLEGRWLGTAIQLEFEAK